MIDINSTEEVVVKEQSIPLTKEVVVVKERDPQRGRAALS
jgi:hypothetical protein